MLRSVDVSVVRVKRSALVSCGLISFGNCFSVRLRILFVSCGCIILSVRFFSSFGSEISLIIFSGSITLFLDLDIFWFSLLRIRSVM